MPPKLHDDAVNAFQSPDTYERGRPSYPPLAVEYIAKALGISAKSVVVDVGAGTGKFTLLLRDTGAELIAVEPSAPMRQGCERFARVVDGTAESLPLPDGSADAIVVAQAFHWFDGASALREFHRVLRPGGGLALIWNVADESVPWMKQMTELLTPYEAGVPRYRCGEWKRAFEDTTGFSALGRAQFANNFRGPPQAANDRILSISFIATLPENDREKVGERVRQILGPERMAAAEIEMPYRTDVFVTRAR